MFCYSNWKWTEPANTGRGRSGLDAVRAWANSIEKRDKNSKLSKRQWAAFISIHQWEGLLDIWVWVMGCHSAKLPTMPSGSMNTSTILWAPQDESLIGSSGERHHTTHHFILRYFCVWPCGFILQDLEFLSLPVCLYIYCCSLWDERRQITSEKSYLNLNCSLQASAMKWEHFLRLNWEGILDHLV